MEAKFKADKSQIEELVSLTGLSFYDHTRSKFWVIKSDNLLVALADEGHFRRHKFHELNIDLWLNQLRSGRGAVYKDGDVVTLGAEVPEKLRGLTGTLGNVDGDAAVLHYPGGSVTILLHWIDNSYEERLPQKIPEPYRQAALEATLTERGQRYGDFDKHAQITQDLKAVMVSTPNWETLTPSAKESLEMIAHKIGRILNGDPTYADSWHDIAGYATLVEKECEHE